MSPEVKNVLNLVQMDENENLSRCSTSNKQPSLVSYQLFEINKMEIEQIESLSLPCGFGSKMDNEEIFYDAEAFIQESMKIDSSFLVYQPELESMRENSIEVNHISEMMKSESEESSHLDFKPIDLQQSNQVVHSQFNYSLQSNTEEQLPNFNIKEEVEKEMKEPIGRIEQPAQEPKKESNRKSSKFFRFSCTRCLERFKTKNERMAHYELNHRTKKEQSVQCPHCSKKLSSDKGLKAHIAGLHSWKIEMHDCPFCQKSFQACDLADHIKQVHPNDRIKIPHVPLCPICMNRFENLAKLRRHLATVHRDLRIKEELDEETRPKIPLIDVESDDSLDAEEVKIPKKNSEPKSKLKLETKCHLCSNHFCSSASLKRHFIKVHLLEKFDSSEKFPEVKTHCTICSTQLSNGTSYRRHMRTQHVDVFLAEEAEREAETERLRVLREEKANERQRMADYYKSLPFDSLKNVQGSTDLREVIRVVTEIKVEEKPQIIPPTLKEIPQDLLRTLSAPSTSTPKIHKKHSKEEKAKCRVCYQVLCSKWSLRRHMKSCHKIEIEENPKLLTSFDCVPSDEEEIVISSESESEFEEEANESLLGYVEGVNYFACPACPQLFPLRIHLKKHCVNYHGVPWASFQNAFKSKRRLGLKKNIFWDGEKYVEDEEPVRYKWRETIGFIPKFDKLLSVRIHRLRVLNF